MSSRKTSVRSHRTCATTVLCVVRAVQLGHGDEHEYSSDIGVRLGARVTASVVMSQLTKSVWSALRAMTRKQTSWLRLLGHSGDIVVQFNPRVSASMVMSQLTKSVGSALGARMRKQTSWLRLFG